MVTLERVELIWAASLWRGGGSHHPNLTTPPVYGPVNHDLSVGHRPLYHLLM